MTPSELEIENSHNQEWSGTSTKFCILSLQLCFWNNGRAIKLNTRFLLLFFGPMKCFWARDCKPWDKFIWRMIFPRSNYITISLRQFMCIKWESVQYLPSTANLQETVMITTRNKFTLTKNNVIRYGNSVGLVWEKVFVSVFRVKLSKEHSVAIRYWGSSSQTPSLFWARQRNSRIFRKKHQLRVKLNKKRCFKCAAQHTIHHSFIGNAYIACPQLIIAKHYFDANCPKIRCSLP